MSLTPTPLANALVPADQLGVDEDCFPLDLFACQECGHVQLLDIVDPEVLFRHYVYVSGTSSSYVEYLKDYADGLVAKLALTTGDLVVEIGSNDGTLLRHFKDAGLDVLGVDPARNIAEIASAAGIETIQEFFTPELAAKITGARGPARLVAANHVFAHADDLEGIVQGVRPMLAPNAVFVFEVSYLLDVYTKVLFDTIYHEHLSYHTVGPLIRFFARNGMELIDVERVSAQGGSLRGTAQLQGGPRSLSASVDRLVSAEREELGADLGTSFLQFGERINRQGTLLKELLSEIGTRGCRVAGYGAPAKATTLMYHFGLDANQLDFIVDQNPLKQGTFTPGLHIPIVGPDVLYQQMPDYLLVLAWNFADTIMLDHQAFAGRGGRFIVPLPELKVYEPPNSG